jgi:cell division protein FtsW (lipid II flippase)
MMMAVGYSGRFFQSRLRVSDLFSLIGLVGAAIIFIVAFSDSDTFLRVNDLIDLRQESNLSSLVYANGWQQLTSYFFSTYGVGLGVNAMGCSPLANTTITEWLQILDLGGQNSNDGSFLLSKIGSEFGFVGLSFFLYVTFFSIKKLLHVSRQSTSLEIISIGWLMVVTLGGFVRSAGYFSGPVVLGILAYMLMRTKKKYSTRYDERRV